MTEPNPEAQLVAGDWASLPGVHRFAHQAMATTFEVIVHEEDERYARQAAQAAFDELDRLETELSRYVENSDISRINNLPAGRPAQIGLDAFECLQLSARLYEETDRAFDITIGLLFKCWLDEDKNLRNPTPDELDFAIKHTGTLLLKLDQGALCVELLTSPVHVDLGGVGKGYAVDKMAQLLREWSINRAVIHGGFSSVLVLDAPPNMAGWPITLSHPHDRRRTLARLLLKNGALSGSGLEKGLHIIDPRTGRPAKGKVAAWSSAADAGTADALSTAFMIMTPAQIERYCRDHRRTSGLTITEAQGEGVDREQVSRFGPWDSMVDFPGQSGTGR